MNTIEVTADDCQHSALDYCECQPRTYDDGLRAAIQLLREERDKYAPGSPQWCALFKAKDRVVSAWCGTIEVQP